MTCKRKITQFPEASYGNLIESNSESPGTDCKVKNLILIYLFLCLFHIFAEKHLTVDLFLSLSFCHIIHISYQVTLGQSVQKSSENGGALHTITKNQAVSKWVSIGKC